MNRKRTMKRIILNLIGLVFLLQGGLVEQELLAQIVSPEVHADRRVTFRLKAPQASEVVVQGIAGLDARPLTRNSEGNWEVTLGPLAPELYSYVFNVDGTVVTDPSNRHVKKWLSVNSLCEVPGDPPLLHELQNVPHGVVHHHIYSSESADAQRGVYVYTPPGYKPDATDRYPLVLLLHGYGDDESAWIEVGRANLIADNLLAQKKIQPMIIAMPYGHPLPIELRTRFDDYSARNLVLMEKDVLQDLLPYLHQCYRIADDPQQSAIVGLSMGGGQSLTIGLKHLDQFAWVGGFSSAAPQGDELDQQFPQLLTDVAETNRRLKLLWIGVGEEDFLLERNQKFIVWLGDKGIEHVYEQTDGGHDWSVWRKYLAEFLPLLFD